MAGPRSARLGVFHAPCKRTAKAAIQNVLAAARAEDERTFQKRHADKMALRASRAEAARKAMVARPFPVGSVTMHPVAEKPVDAAACRADDQAWKDQLEPADGRQLVAMSHAEWMQRRVKAKFTNPKDGGEEWSEGTCRWDLVARRWYLTWEEDEEGWTRGQNGGYTLNEINNFYTEGWLQLRNGEEEGGDDRGGGRGNGVSGGEEAGGMAEADEEAAETGAEAADRARCRQLQLENEGVVCADDWEKLELRCVLSFQRLTDPAKGSGCAHRACCNYQVLRDYVGRLTSGPKHCPLATCGVRLQRTRDVVRDASLQLLLEDAPCDAVAVWLQGDKMRTSPPSRAAERSGTQPPTLNRKPRHSGAPKTSSLPSARKSARKEVIVL